MINEKVKTILENSYVADAHLDLAFDVVKQRAFGRRNVLIEDYYSEFKKANVSLVVSSIYVDNEYLPESGLREALRQMEALRADIDECNKYYMLVQTSMELKEARRKGKIAIILSLEGIEPIGNDLDILHLFKRLGLAGVGICWARRNAAADGSYFIKPLHGTESGLHSFGYKLLDKMIQWGLYLDLSHMNEAGFWDAMEYWQGIPMLSHGNCKALNETERNVTDKQLKKIIEEKGFIGINAMNFTVSNGKTIEQNEIGYVKHIKRVVELGGIDCVGFGFDFNDQILKYIAQQQLDLLPRRPFDCLNGYGGVELVVEELLKEKFTEEQIKKILGENLYNYFIKQLPKEGII